MKEQEKQIWDYIDGQLSFEERKSFEKQLDTDPQFNHHYERLLKVNQGMKFMELESPSSNFTSHLMDKIAALPKRYEIFSSKKFFTYLAGVMILAIALGSVLPGKAIPIQINFNFVEMLDKIIPQGILAQLLSIAAGILVLIWMDHLYARKLNTNN